MGKKTRGRLWCAAAVFLLLSPACAMAQSVPNGRLPLRTGWQLQSSCKINATGEQVSTPGFQTTGWHAATVPSTVLAALVADGTYPDPDFGMNLRSIPGTTYKIGANFANLPMPKDSPFACSWWYRTELNIPSDYQGRTIWLHFDGINYRANIWINGKKFADAADVAGSYRIYDFDVTQFVKPGGANAIAVETFAPTEKDLAMNWVDWNPAPPDKDMGLWDDAYLTATGSVAVRYSEAITHFPDASLSEADLAVTAEVRNAANVPVSAVVEGTIESVHFEQPVQLNAGETRSVTFTPEQFPQLRIAHPKIWWPYGLGPQNLETLTMQARVGDAVSDGQNVRFGIREVISTMQPGNYMLFHINGKRILIRGGGWSPDMLMRQPPHKLEAQFDYVREMGLNTIRLEGKLEPDDFFDLADERGVLVMAGWCCCSFWEQWKKWQPSDLQNATAQLRSQILRLRKHPSLLVWLNGSDNPPPAEVESAYLEVEKQLQWPNPVISSASQRPTSVSGPSGVKMTGPYDYVPPPYWLDDDKNGGAYGLNTETSAGPAPVVIGSLKKMMPADQIWPPNEYWHYHSGSGDFQQLSAFDDAMKQIYGPAKDLQDYERKAQIMAYENERAMFEAYARNKYTSTGVIQWMLNNAWPSLIWHLYDYYLQPAGGYFGAKKANEMVHVQYSYDDRSVVVVNSYYRSFPGLTVSSDLYNINLKRIFSRKSPVDLASDASQRVLTIPVFPETSSPQTYFLKLELRDRDGKYLSSNFYWLSSKPPVFDWNRTTYVRTEATSYEDLTMLDGLPSVKLKITANLENASAGEVTVHLRNPSKHLAFQTRLAIDDVGGNEVLPVFWSDNYIEVMPGESKTITARYPAWNALRNGAKLEVSGWNIEPVTIALSSSRDEASNRDSALTNTGRSCPRKIPGHAQERIDARRAILTRGASHSVGLRRTLGLWDLILYGIIIIQPVAPMPSFEVVSTAARGPRCHSHPHRHGRHVVHRYQLRPHGARISQRGLRLHLCGARTSSRSRLYHRMEHGNGLHLNPLICTIWCSKAVQNFFSADALFPLGDFLCASVHLAESSWRGDVRAHQWFSRGGYGNRHRYFCLRGGSLHLPSAVFRPRIRGGEAFDLLQLLNTGHSGTLSTVHASSAGQALARFTSCVLQSGIELPCRAITSNIADSLNVLIQLERRPGKRFISEVLEIRGYNAEDDRYDLCPLVAARLQ